MVKRQKEKQYQSATEHKANSHLRAGGKSGAGNGPERRLPFHCCALTLTPYQHPVCTSNGIVFENTALLPFLLTHKKDPVTGEPRTTRDVITLNMDKDEEGQWQCPILTKPFIDHTKIVAIRHGNEANVYSWQAYHELNLKTKNMEDLISGEKFTKADVMILNDPDDLELNKARDINNFHHVLHARSLEDSRPGTNVQRSVTATRVMEKLAAYKRSVALASNGGGDSKKPRITSEMVTGAKMTSGMTSGSLTSSSMNISSTSESREATQEEILQAQFAVMKKRKRKGYATLHTNMGDIGLELHCDIAPRTCTNFLGLAESGIYNGSNFHRLIPSFMIQGGKGDPDDSLWGGPFNDEFDDRLKHDDEGIMSMANSGPRTNKRQFFLTFAPAPHLDRKHSIFGRVIQGKNVLREMKKVPTAKKDRPVHDITITGITVLVNPAKEAEELERERIEKLISQQASHVQSRDASALGKNASQAKPETLPIASSLRESGAPAIGKYLSQRLTPSAATASTEVEGLVEKASRLPPPPKKSTFGDFSGW
ncbi:Rtf2 RING-finger [Fragilaria crotonensis]|nr:Rtf2 RING-finger [Fragilaria crotonensis]